MGSFCLQQQLNKKKKTFHFLFLPLEAWLNLLSMLQEMNRKNGTDCETVPATGYKVMLQLLFTDKYRELRLTLRVEFKWAALEKS